MTARPFLLPGRLAGVLGGFLLAALPALDGHAHTGATGPVKHRMEIMKSMGAATKTIQAMLTGKRAYDKGLLARLANEIAGHTPMLPKLFPKGSNKHPSEATPAIWTDWEGFNASLTALQTEARKLAQIAPTGSRVEVARQFRRVGQSCSGCHRDFRKRKR